MMVAAVVVTFVALVALSTPIVFALGLSGMLGLQLGNFSLQKLPSALVAGSQSWVLLAVPTFIFAGTARSTQLCEPATRAEEIEEHTSELQSLTNLVCSLPLEKKT